MDWGGLAFESGRLAAGNRGGCRSGGCIRARFFYLRRTAVPLSSDSRIAQYAEPRYLDAGFRAGFLRNDTRNAVHSLGIRCNKGIWEAGKAGTKSVSFPTFPPS